MLPDLLLHDIHILPVYDNSLRVLLLKSQAVQNRTLLLTQRYIGVQRLVFKPSGHLYGFIKLTLHTQIGKGGKDSTFPRLIISQSLEQADHALLDQIFPFSAHDKHGMRFLQHHPLVLFHEIVLQLLLTVSQPLY